MPTQVTGTLIDSLGQKWANAPIQFVFFPTPNTPGPFTVNDSEFDKMPPVIMTDANGTFSINLISNSDVKPANSQWQMIIGPNSSYPAIVLMLSLNIGFYDVSSLFAASGAVMALQSLYIPRAYADGEVLIPPNSGQLYYNVSTKQFKYWESGNWNVLGGNSSGGMVYPPAGIAVSTGTGWAASIDPAIVAYNNVNNHFSTSQSITGDLSVDGRFGAKNIQLQSSDADMYIKMYNSNAVADEHVWTLETLSSNTLRWRVINDANSVDYIFMQVQRAGAHIVNLTLQSDIVGIGGNFLVTQNSNLNGNVVIGANLTVGGTANVGALQVAGAQPNGYILQSNGTSFVPVPFPSASHGSLQVSHVQTNNSFGVVYQNGPNLRIVTGGGTTHGGTTGSVQAMMGPNNPLYQAWVYGNGGSVNGSAWGFSFTVPPNWQYAIYANTRANPGDSGVYKVDSWSEIDISIV